MRLLIIRHAIAVPHGTPGIADDERPLTAEGEQRFERAARGLARVVAAPDALLTSPLPRARRTAEIAAAAWGDVSAQVAPELIGARYDDVMRLLRARRAAKLIAIVGHEPSLSALVARLLGAPDPSRFTFKKGGAVLLDLGEDPRTDARLLAALPPRILRALG